MLCWWLLNLAMPRRLGVGGEGVSYISYTFSVIKQVQIKLIKKGGVFCKGSVKVIMACFALADVLYGMVRWYSPVVNPGTYRSGTWLMCRRFAELRLTKVKRYKGPLWTRYTTASQSGYLTLLLLCCIFVVNIGSRNQRLCAQETSKIRPEKLHTEGLVLQTAV